MKHHANTRMGSQSFASWSTSSNASKSRCLPKMRILPTARFSTWYAYPPLANRNLRGMT